MGAILFRYYYPRSVFGVCSVIVSGIAPGIFWAGACGITRRAGQKSTYRWWVFFVIAFSWLFWILLNYPGTTSGDGLVQLKQFLGEQDWGGTSAIFLRNYGNLFCAGKNHCRCQFRFFFLYCLLQTLVGGLCFFPLSMKKLPELGISWKWCAVGILFFAPDTFLGNLCPMV